MYLGGRQLPDGGTDSFCYGVAEEVFIPDIDAHEAKLEATHARSPEDLDSNIAEFNTYVDELENSGYGFDGSEAAGATPARFSKVVFDLESFYRSTALAPAGDRPNADEIVQLTALMQPQAKLAKLRFLPGISAEAMNNLFSTATEIGPEVELQTADDIATTFQLLAGSGDGVRADIRAAYRGTEHGDNQARDAVISILQQIGGIFSANDRNQDAATVFALGADFADRTDRSQSDVLDRLLASKSIVLHRIAGQAAAAQNQFDRMVREGRAEWLHPNQTPPMYFKALQARPFYEDERASSLQVVAALKNHADAILSEFRTMMTSGEDPFTLIGGGDEFLMRNLTAQGWNQLELFEQGRWNQTNCGWMPTACRILGQDNTVVGRVTKETLETWNTNGGWHGGRHPGNPTPSSLPPPPPLRRRPKGSRSALLGSILDEIADRPVAAAAEPVSNDVPQFLNDANKGYIPKGQVVVLRMRPGTRLKLHNGITNTRLVAHFGLQIPANGAGIRVGSEERGWKVGQTTVFDDSFDHEAWNDSQEDRYVLHAHVWHPSLHKLVSPPGVENDEITDPHLQMLEPPRDEL